MNTLQAPADNSAITCSSCGSANVATYLYGMVAMDDELAEELDTNRVVLGGCAISDDAPEYYCSDCGNEW